MIKQARKVERWLRRASVDFLAALALFWMLTLALSGPNSSAYAVSLPPHGIAAPAVMTPATTVGFDALETEPSLSQLTATPVVPRQLLVLLSIMVAAMAAFNLAFWRHLRRVYASQRRGVWRRD